MRNAANQDRFGDSLDRLSRKRRLACDPWPVASISERSAGNASVPLQLGAEAARVAPSAAVPGVEAVLPFAEAAPSAEVAAPFAAAEVPSVAAGETGASLVQGAVAARDVQLEPGAAELPSVGAQDAAAEQHAALAQAVAP